ncbi:MAG: anthranilate phosphoribosyltransferase [Myxococcales bacterium]|nr:anthranilate phosphoribosyltransferase [Myxococcales bacterium]
MRADILQRAIGGEALSAEDMRAAMGAMLAGEASEAQMAGLLVALKMRGETVAEIAAAARVMRERCDAVDLGLPAGTPVVDTCGTGGDGAGTFNVSTVSALALASVGVKVAKHGNRAVSSKSGSADLLEALGIPLDVPREVMAASVRDLGIGFFFAPSYHRAVRHVAPVRRALGVRTLFNLLGPLANPAGATCQLLGVYDRGLVRPMAEALRDLGVQSAWVVHGEPGIDEISLHGVTHVADLEGGHVLERSVTPGDFGMLVHEPGAIRGGDAKENAAITERLLAGEVSPYFDAVVMNAAAALVLADRRVAPSDAAARVAEAIRSGATKALLVRWVAYLQKGAA